MTSPSSSDSVVYHLSWLSAASYVICHALNDKHISVGRLISGPLNMAARIPTPKNRRSITSLPADGEVRQARPAARQVPLMARVRGPSGRRLQPVALTPAAITAARLGSTAGRPAAAPCWLRGRLQGSSGNSPPGQQWRLASRAAVETRLQGSSVETGDWRAVGPDRRAASVDSRRIVTRRSGHSRGAPCPPLPALPPFPALPTAALPSLPTPPGSFQPFSGIRRAEWL